MDMEFTIGTKYTCIKDVVMHDGKGTIAYIKGKVYTADGKDYITDEQGYAHRWTDSDEFVTYFRVYEPKIDIDKVAEVKKYIEGMLKYDANGHRELDRMSDWDLRKAICEIYNNIAEDYDDGYTKMFTIYSEEYDWWTNLRVMARNSHNGIFEYCSAVGKVHIVLLNWEHKKFDEGVVEDMMNNTDWTNIVEDYTLYNEKWELVGFVYSDKDGKND